MQENMWVVGAAVSAATFVFYGSFYLGQIWQRLGTLREDVDRHTTQIISLQDRRIGDRPWAERP